MTLNEIVMHLVQRIEDAVGEITPEISDLFVNMTDKVAACVNVVDVLEAEASGLEARADGLKDRAAGKRSRARWLRSYLDTSMRIAGLRDIKTPGGSLHFRTDKFVEVLDASLLPVEYLRPVEPAQPQPDKRELLRALKGGAVIPGVVLGARETLVIT